MKALKTKREGTTSQGSSRGRCANTAMLYPTAGSDTANGSASQATALLHQVNPEPVLKHLHGQLQKSVSCCCKGTEQKGEGGDQAPGAALFGWPSFGTHMAHRERI